MNVIIEELNGGSVLHIINIENLTSDLRKNIDKNIVSIFSKGIIEDLERVKRKIKESLEAKRKSKLYIGLIAEFFMHLYLNNIGFNQESLYDNLEDRQIKKGLDGLYSKNDEKWIVESKSGIDSPKVSHVSQINIAYKDLENKVSGKNIREDGSVISPWDNALYHAKVAESNEKVITSIEKLSKDFDEGKFYSTDDFNIIPSSTIFFDDVWNPKNAVEIKTDLNKWIVKKKYKKMNVICISNKTKDMFLEYLDN